MFFDKNVDVQRLSPTQSDSDKEEYGVVIRGVKVNIQPASSETVALTGGVMGKTFTMFTTRSGIVDGDRVTVSGTFVDGLSQNKELTVANAGNWSFGPIPHFEHTLIEVEE